MLGRNTRVAIAYLDEFMFRYIRRKTRGSARITSRIFWRLVTHPLKTKRDILDKTGYCRCFHAFTAVPLSATRAKGIGMHDMCCLTDACRHIRRSQCSS